MLRSKRVLYLAPMCEYPARDGSSRWILQVAQAIQAAGHHCTVIGNKFILEYGHKETTMLHFDIKWRSKLATVARSLIFGGHYQETKNDNQAYRDVVSYYARDYKPDALIISFIWMKDLQSLAPTARDVIIDTQNDEWVLLDGYIKGSRNPLVRRIAATSKRRLDGHMAALPSSTILMHIAESDVAAHAARRSDIRHICTLPGITATPRLDWPNYRHFPKNLLFCGNLSNKLNNDAISHFNDVYWPALSESCNFIAAGSNPSKMVRNLCQANGWKLVSNFSDAEKMRLYNEAHFAILPLPYGAGSKIKLLESIAYAVPVLTTTAGVTGGHVYPSFVTVSDDPARWLNTVTSTTQFEPKWVTEADAFAFKYTNANTMRPLLDIIGA